MSNYNSLVDFETAKALHAVGFDKEEGFAFSEDGTLFDPQLKKDVKRVCPAPTYADALDFLLDRKKIEVGVHKKADGYHYNIMSYGKGGYALWWMAAKAAIIKACFIIGDREGKLGTAFTPGDLVKDIKRSFLLADVKKLRDAIGKSQFNGILVANADRALSLLEGFLEDPEGYDTKDSNLPFVINGFDLAKAVEKYGKDNWDLGFLFPTEDVVDWYMEWKDLFFFAKFFYLLGQNNG